MTDPLPSPGDSLDRERLLLERERLKFERQKLAIDALLKRRELAGRSGPFKDLLANPLALAVVGGFVTLMTTTITASFTAKQALQADLIKKFVEPTKIETVRQNLEFLVAAGLLPDYGAGIEKYLKDNPNKAPSLGNAAVTGLKFGTQAPYLMRRLMSDFDLKDFQAAAIVGNIAFETAGFSAVQEMATAAGRGGFGYLQWSGESRERFEQFVKDNKLDPATIEANYAFLKHEMETIAQNAVKAVKAATTIEDATRLFQVQAVRAMITNYDARIAWARKALDLFLHP